MLKALCMLWSNFWAYVCNWVQIVRESDGYFFKLSTAGRSGVGLVWPIPTQKLLNLVCPDSSQITGLWSSAATDLRDRGSCFVLLATPVASSAGGVRFDEMLGTYNVT